MPPKAKQANLPEQKKAGRKAAPVSSKNTVNNFMTAQYITLDDGTQVPIKIPPGMPPEQAVALVEYLKNNPDAARAALAQAKQALRTPGLAQAYLNLNNPAAPPPSEEQAKMYEVLKSDPEFATMFEDIQKHGPTALQKYWDDTDLMTKIAAKMRAASLQDEPAEEDTAEGSGTGEDGSAGAAPSKAVPQAAARRGPPADIKDLHEAAKWGDTTVTLRLLEAGQDVNALNERGISPLGVAVGFNRKEMVKVLIEKGANVMLRDGKGNTVLHYAAGYGRRELAELLLQAGAELSATNQAGQKPLDVAKLNRENTMVQFLRDAVRAAKDAAS